MPEQEKLLQVKQIDILQVKNQEHAILFHPSPIGSFSKLNLATLEKQLAENGLKKPSLTELVSLMYAAFSTPEKDNEYVARLRKAFNSENVCGSSFASGVQSFTGLEKLAGGYIIFENLSFDEQEHPIMDYDRLAHELFYPDNPAARIFRTDYKEDSIKKSLRLLQTIAGQEAVDKLGDKSIFKYGWQLRDFGNERNDKIKFFNASLGYDNEKPIVWIKPVAGNLGVTFGKYQIVT